MNTNTPAVVLAAVETRLKEVNELIEERSASFFSLKSQMERQSEKLDELEADKRALVEWYKNETGREFNFK